MARQLRIEIDETTGELAIDIDGYVGATCEEAVRLIEQEKVNMLLGFFSSAQCVPVAARVEQLKNFMWTTTCISSAVPSDKTSATPHCALKRMPIHPPPRTSTRWAAPS